jgi:uncharacterized CHY-type Zn-finger protein
MRKEQIPLKIVRMNPWTKENGATYDEYVSSNWDYYRHQLTQGKKQDAIGSTGRILEQFLVTMRRNLHLAIPATIDDRYTLGALSPAFWKWVVDHPIQRPDFPDLSNRLEILRDEFDAYWMFRNWSGAHYNEWGATVSLEEALTFTSILEELIDYFICPVCSSLVVYDINHKQVHCPICTPTPSPRVVWEYNPNWINQAKRLISNSTSIPKAEKHLLNLSKSAFERVLRDTRRKMHLTVVSKDDDSYEIKDLYTILIQQLSQYPNKAIPEWNSELHDFDINLRQFMTVDLIWLQDEIILPDVKRFHETINSFTQMIGCPLCNELFRLDCTTGEYSCTNCSSSTEKLPIAPAAWFVN